MKAVRQLILIFSSVKMVERTTRGGRKMTIKEVIETELKCVQRDCCRLENECAKCDLVLPKEEIVNAYNEALKLEEENKIAKMQSKVYFELIERIGELKAQIEKMKNCENCRYAYDKKHDCMPCENMEDWELME